MLQTQKKKSKAKSTKIKKKKALEPPKYYISIKQTVHINIKSGYLIHTGPISGFIVACATILTVKILSILKILTTFSQRTILYCKHELNINRGKLS